MNIKPGMLCYLVNLPERVKELSGRVVTVVRRYDGVVWVVDAEWIPYFCFSTRRDPYVEERCLRPIHDPDAFLFEPNDTELTA